MPKTLSPKQVARAIGVSESSLKRWCDQGLLPMLRTAGGHRRLPVAGVLQFLQDTGRDLAHPEVLGLPAAVGTGRRVLQRATQNFADALVAGKEEVARQIVFDLFLQQHRFAEICDEVIAKALENIGHQWECGNAAVYQERRGCEILFRIFHEARQLLPEPRNAKTVLGGSCDPYQLPSSMVELVLRQCGYEARSLGANIPMDSLAAALDRCRPDIFWLSVSSVADEELFLDEANTLFQSAAKFAVPLVVGGRGLTPELRRRMQYTVYCDTLQHLECYVTSIFDKPAQKSGG